MNLALDNTAVEGTMDITETVISSENLFNGRIIKLRRDEVKLADGTKSAREIVEHPGAVCIVACLGNDILLIRQFRLATGGPLLELPAGTRNANETPQVCAARELEEETGYKAESLELLGSFYVAPGYSSELIYAYLATGLSPHYAEQDEDERLLLEKIDMEKLVDMIYAGEIRDAKTIAATLMAVHKIQQKA